MIMRHLTTREKETSCHATQSHHRCRPCGDRRADIGLRHRGAPGGEHHEHRAPSSRDGPGAPVVLQAAVQRVEVRPRARAPGKKLVTALNAVQSASDSEDVPVLLAALKTAGAAAASSARYPMPSCADPHGYWGAMLARIRADATPGITWPMRAKSASVSVRTPTTTA